MKRQKSSQLNKNVLLILGEVNPFMLFSAPEKPVICENAQASYLKLFMLINAFSPRGFIDIPYFMTTYQLVSLTKAVRICDNKELALIEWNPVKCEERIEVLKSICMKLLDVSHVPFNSNAFYSALNHFNELLLLNKTRKDREEHVFDLDKDPIG